MTKHIPIRNLRGQEKRITSEGFSIRTLQSVLDGKALLQERHRHDFFFMIVFEKGKGTHEVDFTSYKVADRTVFFLRPGQVHQLRLKASCTGYVIEFRSDYFYAYDKAFNQLLRKASTKNLCGFDVARFRKITPVLNYIFNECEARHEGYEEVIRSCMKIFFMEMIRQRQSLGDAASSEKKYRQERLEEFLALVESQLAVHKQVQYYADKLHLTPYQLNAITKASLGKTSSAVIDECIVLEAKRYLFATSNRVSEIADLLGYDDVSYFIRFFKKHTGHSPEAFRNNFR